MAADRRGPLLVRVAEVRGQRLKRAAAEAHAAAAEALAASERAHRERAAAAALRAEARAAFTASPACAQARLWLDRTIAGEAGAVAELADQAARLDLARDAHGAAVQALTRHEARSDAVADHHRAVVRVDRRLSEDRAEADAAMTMRVVLS